MIPDIFAMAALCIGGRLPTRGPRGVNGPHIIVNGLIGVKGPYGSELWPHAGTLH